MFSCLLNLTGVHVYLVLLRTVALLLPLFIRLRYRIFSRLTTKLPRSVETIKSDKSLVSNMLLPVGVRGVVTGKSLVTCRSERSGDWQVACYL